VAYFWSPHLLHQGGPLKAIRAVEDVVLVLYLKVKSALRIFGLRGNYFEVLVGHVVEEWFLL
jgi:hypothetical protein